jgi:WhiB family redox-sensing transcriptional regulator
MRRTPTLGGTGARIAEPGYALGKLATEEVEMVERDPTVNGVDWRFLAECAGEDPELFFPIGTSGPAQVQAEEAKAICRRCPVTDECLQWALESGQDAGVWGAMTEEERRAYRAELGLPAIPRRYFRKGR